jgi:hypothetical protein
VIAVGGGTSYYGGYLFKLRGLGFGVSTLDATGSVYNLRHLQDFEGRLWSGSHRTGNRQPRQGGDVAAKFQRRTFVSQSKASRFIPDPGSRRHARPPGRVALPTAPAILFTSGFAVTPRAMTLSRTVQPPASIIVSLSGSFSSKMSGSGTSSDIFS